MFIEILPSVVLTPFCLVRCSYVFFINLKKGCGSVIADKKFSCSEDERLLHLSYLSLSDNFARMYARQYWKKR